MIRIAAYFFGILLIVFGALGFFPLTTPHHLLLGIFLVNTTHNLLHIVTGIIALTVSSISTYASQIFFRILAIWYIITGIAGFFSGNEPIFGIIANNTPNVALHLTCAVGALFIGFSFVPKERE